VTLLPPIGAFFYIAVGRRRALTAVEEKDQGPQSTDT